MKSYILILLFLFLTIPVFSQGHSKLDSLRMVFKLGNIDENRLKITDLLKESIRLSKDSTDLFIDNSLQKIDHTLERKHLLILMASVGNAYRDCGYGSTAITYYKKGLAISKEIKDKHFEGVFRRRIGDVYLGKGLYPEALENLSQGQAVLQELADTMYQDQKQAILLSISQVYSAIGDYSKALDYQLKIMNSVQQDRNQGDSAYIYYNIAYSYFLLKDYDKALNYVWKSETLFDNVGRVDFVAACYKLIGEIYYQRDDYLNALDYYTKANKKFPKNFLGDIADLNGDIAATYIKLGQYNKALSCCENEYKYAMKVTNSKDLIQSWAENLSNAYEGLKDYKSALKYYKISSAYKDSLKLEESKQKIQKLEMKNEFASELQAQELIQKQKDTEIDAKLRQQKLTRNFAIGGIILLLFGLFFAIRSYNVKRKSNILLAIQKKEIEEKKEHIEYIHHEVTQSIEYAKRIQSSIFPDEALLDKYLSDHFIMLQPKDRVSGDFYWWAYIEDSLVIAVADCTGHGVPGAFMSMLGISFLREIVTKEYITQPDVILRRLRKEIMNTLKQEGKMGEQKDGLDIALISINFNANVLQFAGANNPLYIIRNGNLTEIKADKMPISIYDKMDKFTNNEFQLNKGDNLYLFSDGFADQFGGASVKKFKYKPFQELLISVSDKSMDEQKKQIFSTFNNWKQSTEQTDDVLVVGLKI